MFLQYKASTNPKVITRRTARSWRLPEEPLSIAPAEKLFSTHFSQGLSYFIHPFLCFFPVYRTLSDASIGWKQERVLREQDKFRYLKTLVHTLFLWHEYTKDNIIFVQNGFVACQDFSMIPFCHAQDVIQAKAVAVPIRFCRYTFSEQGHKFSI